MALIIVLFCIIFLIALITYGRINAFIAFLSSSETLGIFVSSATAVAARANRGDVKALPS